MRAGSLRQRIQIYAVPSAQDAGGQPLAAGDGDLVLECWATIRAATSKEIYALGAGFDGKVTHAITIRYPDTLPASGMTIKFRDRTFRLQTLSDPDEMRRELDLMSLEQSK